MSTDFYKNKLLNLEYEPELAVPAFLLAKASGLPCPCSVPGLIVLGGIVRQGTKLELALQAKKVYDLTKYNYVLTARGRIIHSLHLSRIYELKIIKNPTDSKTFYRNIENLKSGKLLDSFID